MVEQVNVHDESANCNTSVTSCSSDFLNPLTDFIDFDFIDVHSFYITQNSTFKIALFELSGSVELTIVFYQFLIKQANLLHDH